jgi:hypothetical protein
MRRATVIGQLSPWPVMARPARSWYGVIGDHTRAERGLIIGTIPVTHEHAGQGADKASVRQLVILLFATQSAFPLCSPGAQKAAP